MLMKRLWAPWRTKYISSNKNDKGNCIFCQKSRENKDKENYILFRGKKCLVMLNAFPYNNGHLMVAPYRHIGCLEDLTPEEGQELVKVASQMLALLKRVLHPEGFNLGMNIGEVAGAGIADHLHLHIVPRWKGDSNFMPVISEVKVLSESLDETYRKLRAAIDSTNLHE
jgi:ATP adenylyltransferase